MSIGRLSLGHGHVRPNPDGSRARCGGPVMCSVCALEKAQFDAQQNDKTSAAESNNRAQRLGSESIHLSVGG